MLSYFMKTKDVFTDCLWKIIYETGKNFEKSPRWVKKREKNLHTNLFVVPLHSRTIREVKNSSIAQLVRASDC